MESSNESEKKFYEVLEIKANLVQLYEDINLLNYALEFIPFEELSNRVSEKQVLLENDATEKVGSDDLLILELLNWFKSSFFSWVDVPKCKGCGQLSVKRGMVPPSESELDWGANRVEHYFCTPCQKSIRFPRYNHPKKLLKTRKGRCGEWANCFTLLCRALGYEARLVMDWNDHIWTEVFSQTQNRWLHCDSCENICDKPLLYELGWKKDITYVIAFSKDEVQDVTWRYTSKFSDVLSRRNLCRESWLTACIMSFTSTLQSTLPNNRKSDLQRRRALELVEFLSQPKAVNDDYRGRVSGSLAWRKARGECSTVSNFSFIFTLNENEIQNRCFHIKYNCALDKYVHVSDQSTEKFKWEACTFEHSGIFRKIETDWKLAYLARVEGSPKGHITWKFDFKESGLVIQSLKLNLYSQTFQNGVVKWLLSSSHTGIIPKEYKPDVVPLVSEDFKGASELIITAELTGGVGEVAWQHAQLFRQALDSQEFPFEVQIYLEKV